MTERTPIYLTNLQLSDLFLALQLKQLAGFEDTDQPSAEQVHAALMGIDCLEAAIDAAIALGERCKQLKYEVVSGQKTARTPAKLVR